jgi:hypothetical protein
MTVIDTLLIMLCCGILVIGNGFLVGWLVYLAKRESHETLSPQKRSDEPRGPVHMDEFAITDDSGLPDVTRANVARMNEVFGVDLTKGG